MSAKKHRDDPFVANAVWPLVFLTAALHAYVGLSAVAYVFMGVSKPASGLGGWTIAAAGGLETIAAIAGFVLAVRRDLRGATLAIAGGIVMGWLSTLPSVLLQGLDFGGDDMVTPAHFVISPLIALAGAALAWRNDFPVAAALVVTATTFMGVLAVLAFAVIIAVNGF